MRARISVVAALMLFWLASAANAVSFTLDSIPAGPLTSGNGQFQIDNVQFFSPFNTVSAGDVTFEVLDDGVKLSGPVSASGTDIKNFFVLYDVTALGGGSLDRASLLLDSHVDADILGLVFATKGIFDDGQEQPHKDKDKFPFHHAFDFGPGGMSSLALLRTADWQLSQDERPHFNGPLGLGNDGAIRQVEAGFDGHQSIKVVDGVTVSTIDGDAEWQASTNHFHVTGVIPEPGVGSLTGLGLLMLGLRRRRLH